MEDNRKKYKYYQWINPTKSKKDYIKEHDGGFVKKVDAETNETVEIIFIDMTRNEDFIGFHFYTGTSVPFKGDIDETDVEITEHEYNVIASIAMNAEFICRHMFSQKNVDRCNEQIRRAKEEKARAAEKNKK